MSLHSSTKKTHGLPGHQSTQFAHLKGFNFNTNIQIGDISQVFYSTLYTSKSTQEEDSEKQLQIGCAVIKRIKRLLEKTSSKVSSNDECNQAMLEPSS